MRICIVSGIFPPDIGGPATYLLNICKQINDSGHKISVITFGDEYADFPFLVQKISRKIPPFIRILLAFVKIIRLHKEIDIIFTLGGPWDSGIPGLLAKIVLHKPMVTKVNGDIAWERARIKHLIEDSFEQFQIKKYSIRVEFFRWIQKFVVKRADAIIVPSNYLKPIVSGWGIPRYKINIVYNAIGKDFRINISQEMSKKYLDLQGRIISTVTRLIPLKGIDKLIEVIKELDDDIRLLVLGDGPEKENLKRLARSLDIEDKIIFRDRIPRNKIPLYLGASEIFVLNSESEGLPHVILEAMACGVPIIATNVGGIPEVIGNEKDGLLIERGNSAQLKTAILRLLEDKRLKSSVIENAKEKVKSFPLDKMVDEILEILQCLVLKKKKKNIFQKQLTGLKRSLAFFVFYSGILWLIQSIIKLIFKRERVLILAYHRVTDKSDFITRGMGGRDTSVKNFERHMQYLKKNYQIISLDDFIKYIKGASCLPKRSAIITFDDGYIDTYTNAFPIFKKYNIPATIFLMVDFINAKKLMWLHKFYYPKDLLSLDKEAHIASGIYLSWDQVKEMSQAGVSIGSHTLTHRILSQLNQEEAKDEILGSKDKIEGILNRPVLHFAYPFGDNGSFSSKIKEIVRMSGFLSACSRFEGINTRHSDLYALKRIGIGDCRLATFASKLVLNEILAIILSPFDK